MAKADNLLALLALLRSRGQMTAAQIAEQLGITVRTVYRYVDALCASGAPIASEGGPGGGFLLLDTFRDPPLFFDGEERTALLHASILAEQSGYPLSEALRRALQKIRFRMDEEQLGELERHAAAVGVVPQRQGAPDARRPLTTEGRPQGAAEPRPSAPAKEDPRAIAERLAVLERAAAGSQALVIDYSRLESAAPTRRIIEPYGLVYWRSMWYVVGYCRLRREVRIFRCDRISSIAETRELFERPAGFSAADWFAGRMLPAPSREDSITARIEGAPGPIDHLACHWFLRGLVRRRGPSAVELVIGREAAMEHLPPLLLGYGTSIRVTAPAELADRLATLSAEVAAFHASVASRSGGHPERPAEVTGETEGPVSRGAPSRIRPARRRR